MESPAAIHTLLLLLAATASSARGLEAAGLPEAPPLVDAVLVRPRVGATAGAQLHERAALLALQAHPAPLLLRLLRRVGRAARAVLGGRLELRRQQRDALLRPAVVERGRAH